MENKMSYYKQKHPRQESLQPLSPQVQEEIIINALENHLRRLALGRQNMQPRWSFW
jgi:hypothetical protein